MKDKNGKTVPDSDFENDLDWDIEATKKKYLPDFTERLVEDLKKIQDEKRKP